MEQIEQYRHKAIGMLRSYNDNKVQIKMLQSKIKEVSSRTDIGSMAVTYDQPNSGQTNRVSSVVESALVCKEHELELLKNELARMQGQIERIDIALNNMPIHQRNLLRLKYIERYSWKQITGHLPYSEVYIRRELRNRALDMLTGYLFPELAKVNLFEREKENV